MSINQDIQTTEDNLKIVELEDSLKKLLSLSEEQFKTIKHEKWYTRLWDTITFSNKGEIRRAEQICTLAQAQQIVAQYVLKASRQNKDLSDFALNNASYIQRLAGQARCFKKELTSISNLILLLNEINNEQYSGFTSITAMCLILSQLDNDIMSDRRSINNILLSLNNHNVLNGENIDVIDFLMDVGNISEEEMPLVYTELSTISENYYANLALAVIEKTFFVEKHDISREDVVLEVAIEYNVEKIYDTTTLNKIFISFLNSLISKKIKEGDFALTNPSAKQERENAEKLFYAGKLVEAYPKFIHAADAGDARACYFAACYYFHAYGTTEKSDELYEKYVNLGVQRRDPFCTLEYSKYLDNQGEKEKSEDWKNKVISQVGKLADKGDMVACHLIANEAFSYIWDNSSFFSENKKEEVSSETEKERFRIAAGIHKSYSAKAMNGGYWPTAFSKTFSPEMVIDSKSRKEAIEKYGWMYENVEWADIQVLLGFNYLSMDKTVRARYYKSAAECFVKAFKLQKDDSLCGLISFLLSAGIIGESVADGIEAKNIKVFYYKGLDSNEPAKLQQIGDLYFYGLGANNLGMDKASAFEYYERAYEKYNNENDARLKILFKSGKAETAYMIGVMFADGIGIEKNINQAVHFYQIASENGEERAIKALANCYLKGIGVEKNIDQYTKLISKIKKDNSIIDKEA
ncbi:TPR repeat [Butyrivibrio sp. ob235]|uniref:tetratricopeptide repeat protein n=1 Tax=Butyrivibrio sp. ob235 TaxID=1761780 RepID=UPI0008C3C2A2|nr:tetratricopeptide repeat protein [Butyrivibrio sp. ob235]SEL77085.1 TPR repeat [Butyrivibrio sp. ob235]